MKTRTRTLFKIGALLLALVLLGVATPGTGARLAAAPRAPVINEGLQAAPMAPLPEVTCTVVDTTRTCELWALPGTLDLPGITGLPVWGFGTSAAGPALVPGPVIRAVVGETLQVVLHNEILGQTVALAFPGQELIPDLDGVPAGGMATYSLNPARAGTFLYEAGLTAGGARQVAMGLYGALVVEDPAALPDQEQILVFSEVDPAFSINPAGFSMIDYHPRYWLINGQAYPDTGTIDVAAGTTLLLRYLNAGVQHRTIGLLGLSQEIVAADGEQLPFHRGSVAEPLAPGETKEALVAVPATAETGMLYPLYNASLHQHNNSQRLTPPDTRVAFGGMLTFLQVTGGGGPGGAGPVASGVMVAPQKTDGAVDVILSATLTDTDLVAAYETFVDTVGPEGTGTVVAIAPTSPANVAVTFLAADVATWGSGEHTLYIRGQDGPGAWGTLGSAVLNLDMAGPAVVGLSLAPNPTNGAVDVVLTGTADDRNNGNSNVMAAEYRIDGGAWQPMILGDPAGTTPVSGFSATIPAATVAALPEGQRVIEVQAQDDLLNWTLVPGAVNLHLDKTGPAVPTVTLNPPTLDFNQAIPVTSVRLTASIADPLLNGVQSVIVNAEGFLYTQGAPGTGFDLYPSDGLFNEITEDAYYNIPVANFASLPTGDYDIFVVGKDKAGNWGPAGWATLHVEAIVPDTTGPAISNLVADVANNGRRFDLTATATDTQSNVIGAVWYDGADPGTTYAMSAVDRTFDSLSEDVEALRIDITGWASGSTHQIWVQAIDAAGNWGDAVSVDVTRP